eukprot:1367661-Pyramimonas_sp.AAC.1
MKSELITAIGAANARVDALEVQMQGLQAQQVTSIQEMSTLVSNLSINYQLGGEVPKGDGLIDHGRRWQRLAWL